MLLIPPLIGSTAVKSHVVMHVVFRSLHKTFVYAAKQACEQLQHNKTKLLEPASINGLHIHRGLGASITNYTHQMKINVGLLTLLQSLLVSIEKNLRGLLY